ncbi:C4-type zinc ribbon domain-containing protein [Thermodesulfovibrionales bacterium]|nr:C4-type zinc ribbon domain-containing protein [Thermodesulfovibrionales bacterium]MCL0040383.1 C4-type zinc ribbon domain-containing protein [Thermodesulfovibrionales bacterium]MCL0049830.1 C4-type zinc ribbon domain-containing protein [Thermodesulfovibrionales bacterium]MCL0068323.1 C4-type zinc ribbon domain-containing protein [Thermodesulfovibrionales bacterium]MCL0085927.1 C4-type zinc ribbon domain-containing protein [Thermodesulfovibrionales bacterium]
MDEQLRLLIALQELDSTIISTKLKIGSMPAKVSSIENSIKDIQEAHERTKQQHVSLDKKRRDKESAAADIEGRIKKLKERTSEIKTNKEYQAHLKEIEKADKELRATEDDLLSIMDLLERTTKALKTEEDVIAEEKAKKDAIKREIDKDALRHEAELKRLKEDRKKLSEKIEVDIYDQYMVILNTGRGIAVTEAKKEICQGCNLHIPPQLFVEVKGNNKIIHCPHCKRILYYVRSESP